MLPMPSSDIRKWKYKMNTTERLTLLNDVRDIRTQLRLSLTLVEKRLLVLRSLTYLLLAMSFSGLFLACVILLKMYE
mgnify:CR=1 FL=1